MKSFEWAVFASIRLKGEKKYIVTKKSNLFFEGNKSQFRRSVEVNIISRRRFCPIWFFFNVFLTKNGIIPVFWLPRRSFQVLIKIITGMCMNNYIWDPFGLFIGLKSKKWLKAKVKRINGGKSDLVNTIKRDHGLHKSTMCVLFQNFLPNCSSGAKIGREVINYSFSAGKVSKERYWIWIFEAYILGKAKVSTRMLFYSLFSRKMYFESCSIHVLSV